MRRKKRTCICWDTRIIHYLTNRARTILLSFCRHRNGSQITIDTPNISTYGKIEQRALETPLLRIWVFTVNNSWSLDLACLPRLSHDERDMPAESPNLSASLGQVAEAKSHISDISAIGQCLHIDLLALFMFVRSIIYPSSISSVETLTSCCSVILIQLGFVRSFSSYLLKRTANYLAT